MSYILLSFYIWYKRKVKVPFLISLPPSLSPPSFPPFWYMDTQLFQRHLLEGSSFILLSCLCSFVRNQLTIQVWVNFWISCPVLLIYVPTFSPIPDCLDYHFFRVRVEIKFWKFSTLFPKIVLFISAPLLSHIKFQNQIINLTPKFLMESSTGIVLNL